MSEDSRIYLDHHATTPTDPRVAEVVLRHLTQSFGNAHSTDHSFGLEAEEAVQSARGHVAKLVGASPRSVVFTSGATEALNLAIQGWVRERFAPGSPAHVLLTPVEHRAVLETCEALRHEGLAVLEFLSVDEMGRLDLDEFAEACARGADLACVMAANNEIGNVYPLPEIAEIAMRHGVTWICDATQAAGRIPLDVDTWGVQLLVLSGHKMYGPKGVGALIVQPGVRLRPLFYGGGHERGFRPGTLDVPGIAGLGEAARLRLTEMAADEPVIAARRDRLWELLRSGLAGLVMNGDTEHRLAGNLHLSIPGVPNTAVIARVGHRVALSTGSACSSGTLAPSHVLRALRLPDARIDGALRFGIGKFTTDTEIDTAADLLLGATAAVRDALA
ncbi:MAG: iscS 3 [Gemmatimonadetes bacterium]|nr:iscS 3 [Gemmatimonadota bacterium]